MATQTSTGAHRTKKKNPPSLWATNTGHSAELSKRKGPCRYPASAPSCYISSFLLSCLCVPQVSLETSTPLPGQFSISPALNTPYQLVPPRPLHQYLHLLFTCSPHGDSHATAPSLQLWAQGTGNTSQLLLTLLTPFPSVWRLLSSRLSISHAITCSYKMCCF